MKLISLFQRSKVMVWVAGASAIFVLTGAGVAAAAVRFDSIHRNNLLAGVSIGDVQVGGLGLQAAQVKLQKAFEDPLDRSISVRAGGRVYTTTPHDLGFRTDALARLKEATRIHGEMPFLSRLWMRMTGKPLGRKLPVATTIRGTGVADLVDRIAGEVDRPAVSAAYRYTPVRITLTPEREGLEIDRKASVKALRQAVLEGAYSVSLEEKVLAPATRLADIRDIVVVAAGANKLYHFRGEELVKEYDVATGTREFPTPLGEFKIVSKRRNPTWVNPAKSPGDWGEKLPARIGPSPGNPLGTRALDLSVSGIRIHGTYTGGSIGYSASHGCIRMRIQDVEELFDNLKVGTPVFIYQEGDFKPMPRRGAAPPTEALAENDGTRVPGQPAAPVTPAGGVSQPASPAPAPAAAPTSPAPVRGVPAETQPASPPPVASVTVPTPAA